MTRLRWIIFAAVLIAVAAVAVPLYLNSRNSGAVVSTVTVTKGSITRFISASGKMDSRNQAVVSSSVPGEIVSIKVKDGGTVKKGQVLALLDDTSVNNSLRQAEAAYSKALANRDAVRAGLPSQKELDAAQAQIDEAEALYESARDLYRARKSKSNNISRLKARSALLAVRANLDKLQRARGNSPQLIAAESQLNDARAAVDKARNSLSGTTIEAPRSGRVFFEKATSATPAAGKVISVGLSVSPGQLLFSIADFDTLVFAANVDESDVSQVKRGQTADVVLDAFANRTFSGLVKSVALVPSTTQSGGTAFEAQIRILDVGATPLRLGMGGSADIKQTSRSGVLTVPFEAIQGSTNSPVVYRVRNGKIDRVGVKLGISTDTEVEVVSGLRQGDTVVVSDASNLQDGDPVRIKGE